ncbi:MbnP family protein [Wenyingzhuangia sp. IMCC45467]
MKTLKKMALLALTTTVLISCNNNDESIKEGTHVSAVVKFDHSLALGDEFTLTDSNNEEQTLTLNKFKFIISDVMLRDSENNQIHLPNNIAANLIDLANADETNKVKIYLTEIPEGSYQSISFGLGVSKEVANGSTEAQERLMELAEADMQWSWNPNSYIFSKIEASNTNTETTTAPGLIAHIGDKGDFSGYTTIDLTFPETLIIKKEVSPSIHVIVSINKLFTPDNAGETVAFDLLGHGGSSEATQNLITNYKEIFEVHHLHPNEEAINLEDVEEDTHSHDDTTSEDSHSH